MGRAVNQRVWWTRPTDCPFKSFKSRRLHMFRRPLASRTTFIVVRLTIAGARPVDGVGDTPLGAVLSPRGSRRPEQKPLMYAAQPGRGGRTLRKPPFDAPAKARAPPLVAVQKTRSRPPRGGGEGRLQLLSSRHTIRRRRRRGTAAGAPYRRRVVDAVCGLLLSRSDKARSNGC
jgi:hypothetical protein